VGSTQFKPGTGFWSTEAVGMAPPINWGHHLSEDRYRRITRCLSEAEPLPEGTSSRDRWRDITWVVTAFNKNRKSKVAPGWLLCVDESMIAWTGNGCPHISFVPRKPEPRGIEIKNLCDATSGLTLFLEIQDFPAAIATTLRLLDCVSESHVPPNLRIERLCAMGSWFASATCAKALWNLLKMRSIEHRQHQDGNAVLPPPRNAMEAAHPTARGHRHHGMRGPQVMGVGLARSLLQDLRAKRRQFRPRRRPVVLLTSTIAIGSTY
jgi:hypothetical protein